MKLNARKLLAPLVLVVLMLSACGSGLPEGASRPYEAMLARSETVEQTVKEAKAAYDEEMKKQSKYQFLRAYSAVQRHENNFQEAEKKFAAAVALRDSKLKEIVNAYDTRAAEFEPTLTQVNTLLNEAEALAKEPLNWANTIVRVKDNPELARHDTRVKSDDITQVNTRLKPSVDAAKKEYPFQAAEIDKRFAVFTSHEEKSKAAVDTVEKELVGTAPNFAIVAEGQKTAIDSRTAVFKDEPVLAGALKTLPDVEVHTLIDIKVDSKVEISRTSWDESVDADTDRDFDYPPFEVDAVTADYFSKFQVGQVLAMNGKGWFTDGFKTVDEVDRTQWNKLGLEPDKDWPNGSNAAEYYFDGLDETYCHKLRVMKDGKSDASGRPDPATNPCSKYDVDTDLAEGIYWVEADDFDGQNIGMDVYSKSAGEFADQAAVTEASPPGMALVNDPAYGEWREDTTGTHGGGSYWFFHRSYGYYPQLVGGPSPYYSRSEWNDWNNNYRRAGKPYYSSVNGQPRFGAKSPQTASRFAGSSYVTTGLQDATVRNAGVAARAGGPGGGGK